MTQVGNGRGGGCGCCLAVVRIEAERAVRAGTHMEVIACEYEMHILAKKILGKSAERRCRKCQKCCKMTSLDLAQAALMSLQLDVLIVVRLLDQSIDIRRRMISPTYQLLALIAVPALTHSSQTD